MSAQSWVPVFYKWTDNKTAANHEEMVCSGFWHPRRDSNALRSA